MFADRHTKKIQFWIVACSIIFTLNLDRFETQPSDFPKFSCIFLASRVHVMQQKHLRLELVFLRISTSSGWLNDSEIFRQRLGQLRAQQRQQRQRTIHSLLFDLKLNVLHGCWCPLCVCVCTVCGCRVAMCSCLLLVGALRIPIYVARRQPGIVVRHAGEHNTNVAECVHMYMHTAYCVHTYIVYVFWMYIIRDVECLCLLV